MECIRYINAINNFSFIIGSDSDESEKSDVEMDTTEKEKKPEKSKTDSPTKSSSMPLISSEKTEDDLPEDLDSSIDRSPPKLMKQIDICKETVEPEEKVNEKEMSVEEPLAPILNVVEMEKDNEPILEKLEAQLNSNSEKVEKPLEMKEAKKKESDRRGRKPLVKPVFKIEKSLETEISKKVVKEKEEIVVEKESVKVEDSLYEFKDDPEVEIEVKVGRKKPVDSIVVKDEQKEVTKPEVVKEVVTVLQGSIDDSGKELASVTPHLLVEKDSAKSDSEVERRGRKKKTITVKEAVKEIKIPITNVSVDNSEALITTVPPEKKPFITLAEKKQGFSPMVRKMIPMPEKPDIESAKLLLEVAEADKGFRPQEIKKMPDLLVVHKASPVKTDIVLGRKVDTSEQEEIDGSFQEETDKVKEEEVEVPSVKKKVRKKTKKKIELEDEEQVVVKKPTKRGPGRRSKEVINRERDLESAIASKDNSMDIDLRCQEEIRSRSASPETVSGKSFIQESQGFVPRIETIDCRISDSQGSDNFSLKHDKPDKSHTMNKSNVYENTPPTTPEHDCDDAVQQQGHNDQIKTAGKLIEEAGSKTDSSQAAGCESPVGNASPSNRSTGSSSGVIAGSEGSIDVPVYSTKRRRESDEPTPTKRRKRACRGKSTSSRTKQLGLSFFHLNVG